MVQWRTRTRGTAKQRGKHFPIIQKGDKHNLPKALKVVSTKPRFTEQEIIEAGKDELRDLGIEFQDKGSEVTIPIRTRRIRRTKAKQDEDKPLEYDWWEAQRRRSALRRNKVIIR